jgi:hypothetical protein
MTNTDDKKIPEEKINFEDIEASLEKEMNAVEDAEQAVNAGFMAAQKEL